MTIRLPANLCPRPVSNEPCTAPVRSPDQESRHGVHTILQTLPPLKNPVERYGHVMRKYSFHMRMDVDEVDRTGACGGQHSKVVPLRKKGIERSESFRVWIVSAGDVRLGTEPRFKPNRRKSIARFGRNSPSPDVSCTERAELPEALVVKIPSGPLRRDGARNPCAQRVALLLSCASFESRLLAVQTQVIRI